jgi:hypothetical protein
MPPKPLPIRIVPLESREGRSRFVASAFADYLTESVLDVGCYEAPLRKILTGVRYTGVDFVGDPDIQLNLEGIERLPFEDASQHCVLCIDVLEHLANLHAVFDELLRVSARYVIISLPNAWSDARRPIERGQGRFLHYGLPVDAPVDRHKWFFNISEARSFVEQRAERLGARVVEAFVAEKPRSGLVTSLRRLRYPGQRYQNRYGRTLWAVLERSA